MATWSYTKCRCGHAACNKYRLDFAGAEGMVEEHEAKLICAAPDLLGALEQTLEALTDAVARLDSHDAGMVGAGPIILEAETAIRAAKAVRQ